MRVKPIPYLCLAVFLVIGCEQDAPTAAIEDADLAAPMTADAPAGQVAASKGGMSGNGGPFEFNPAGDTENNSYIVFGVDWNELLGVSEQILHVGSAGHPLNQVSPGEFALAWKGWVVTDQYSPEVKAELEAQGYVFRGETPAEDFIAKVDHVYVIIHPGEPQERTLVWEGSSAFRYFPLSEWGIPIPDRILINGFGMVPPHNPGEHTVVFGLVMAELHNDGFGTEEENFLMPGPEAYFGEPYEREHHFTVVSK